MSIEINISDEQKDRIVEEVIADVKERLVNDLYDRIYNDVYQQLNSNKSFAKNYFDQDKVQELKRQVTKEIVDEIKDEVKSLAKHEFRNKSELVKVSKRAIRDMADEYFEDELRKIFTSYEIDVKINKKEKKNV